MTAPPSPAVQAVMDAFLRAPCDNELSVAAALRALVQHEGESVYTCDEGKFSVVREDRILAIAAELEADRG